VGQVKVSIVRTIFLNYTQFVGKGRYMCEEISRNRREGVVCVCKHGTRTRGGVGSRKRRKGHIKMNIGDGKGARRRVISNSTHK